MSGSCDAQAGRPGRSAVVARIRAVARQATQNPVPAVGRAGQEAMTTMNVMTSVNVNSTRRPRRLPVTGAVRPRAPLTVRASRGSLRGHGSPRGSLGGRGRQATRAVAESREQKLAAARDRGAP